MPARLQRLKRSPATLWPISRGIVGYIRPQHMRLCPTCPHRLRRRLGIVFGVGIVDRYVVARGSEGQTDRASEATPSPSHQDRPLLLDQTTVPQAIEEATPGPHGFSRSP